MTLFPTTQRRTDRRLDSPGQLALVGVIVWLVGAVLHPLAVLVPIGILILLLAGLAYLLRPRTQSMYWRGRRIDLDGRPSPAAKLYRMFFKR
jgi:hypothetical protein